MLDSAMLRTTSLPRVESKPFVKSAGSAVGLRDSVAHAHCQKPPGQFGGALACGGIAMNSFDDLAPECLGKAGLVYEHVLVRVLYCRPSLFHGDPKLIKTGCFTDRNDKYVKPTII